MPARMNANTSINSANRRRRGRPPKSSIPRTEQILETAFAMFACRGYDGTSLRLIASEVEVDVALIAHSFGSKLELWKNVIDAAAARMNTVRVSIQDEDIPSWSDHERLCHVLLKLTDSICDTPHLARFLINHATQEDDHFEYIYLRIIEPLHAYLMPLIDRAKISGSLKNVDPNFFFFTLTGAVALTVTSRRYLELHAPIAIDEITFRSELKRAVLFQLSSAAITGAA